MPRQQLKQPQTLQVLDFAQDLEFEEPRKRINEGQDVSFFLTTKAYTDILTFLLQLNTAMFPRKADASPVTVGQDVSEAVMGIASMIQELSSIVDEAPPDPGPRRFGNVAFKKWFEMAESRSEELMTKHLPQDVTSNVQWKATEHSEHSPMIELKAYLMGSFGSSQRLDYGSGHELSFLAFLACIWKLRGFQSGASDAEQRNIVTYILMPYFDLVRRLIKMYSLEPAGSHGVWGLDDHSFIPYIFGSAQLSPAISDILHIPPEGSLATAPDPADVVKADVVNDWRKQNLYFAAIGFIYDMKKGPFWEHSPMLFDISGVKAGWAKINKGMIKMYIAEVLSKLPVVQHFPFGTMFRWEQDPHAQPPPTVNGANNTSIIQSSTNQANSPHISNGLTAAPWAVPATAPQSQPLSSPTQTQRAPQRIPSRDAVGVSLANAQRQPPIRRPMKPSIVESVSAGQGPSPELQGATKAPWAK